ncbi:mycofactocin-coupled SDR family oxidoreductase [Mycolicibacterium sp. P9-22]|uniref:mycofactocin-coupled SDR family oxidoreductase n=1 Tax=Mycolicibacterium sp. P9-22 TaxID=2024613 RepID=UPI0011EC577F|nr:mycofactocin-coupled SDR family oxidoreductase [Mycolicibacterium sp. P9-22]KAA0120925.1 NAD(P)-dependent oxidoreductase [Mycolicibacterium sp. P9-22]
MSGRLEGQVAFITGAARGQGRAHAVRLAEEGADIIAVDICAPVETVGYPMSSADDLAETVALVEKFGGRAVAFETDVRDFDALTADLKQGVAELGRLDIVVANAGILTMGAAHEQSEEQWSTMLDVNLTGVWHTVKAAIPILIDQGTGGSMILTSSLMGLKGGSWAISYAAAKFGVVGITKSLAIELAPHRIRVNTVHPTNVHTPMLDNDFIIRTLAPDVTDPTWADTSEFLSSMNAWPLPTIEAQDVSNAVLFLASEESRFVTGISLPIDLGATAK